MVGPFAPLNVVEIGQVVVGADFVAVVGTIHLLMVVVAAAVAV